MFIPELIERAMLMLNNPDNEYEVINLLEGLESDFLREADKYSTPTERVLMKLKEMGEDIIAVNIVFPIYEQEQRELEKYSKTI